VALVEADDAASLVADPAVLFLDEPTTGLDPHSRSALWEELRGLVAGGTTLVLTTQYLEEADRLADEVVVIDHGRVIAAGTPAVLKAQLGAGRVVVGVADRAQLAVAAAVLDRVGAAPVALDAAALQATVDIPAGTGLGPVARTLDEAGVPTDDIALHRPTLDDVFLALTGHAADDAAHPAADGAELSGAAR